MSPRHQAATAKIGIAPPTAVAKAAQPATSTISNIQNRIGAGGQANTAGTQEFLQRGRIASAAQTRQQLNAINAANKRRGWLDRWWSGGGQGS